MKNNTRTRPENQTEKPIISDDSEKEPTEMPVNKQVTAITGAAPAGEDSTPDPVSVSEDEVPGTEAPEAEAPEVDASTDTVEAPEDEAEGEEADEAVREPPPRYVVIHGHFYQPPRENPWTEAIERQETAHPFHDWNERIAFECYIPNSSARINTPRGKVVDLVNNYAFMSFNFGPTLLSWMKTTLPKVYRWITSADATSRKLQDGHGNAIAQAYNHMILPLASPQDLETQIIWGKRDFAFRFGREAEAMWLPETAIDQATMEALIEHGMKFVILAPGQAEMVRPLDDEEWIDVSYGDINPRRAYRVFSEKTEDEAKTGKNWDTLPHIDAFFYDGGLAQNVAFGDLLKDSHNFANRIMGGFDPDDTEPQIVHVATDGESYGHHKPFADLTLAYTLKYALPEWEVEVINYPRFLSLHPPKWEARLKKGPQGEGTSWSCAHGVGRWYRDCSCSTGGQPGWHQRWRKPLREALDWLRDEIYQLLESGGGKLFKDPWAARNDYIDVMLDRSPETVDRFLKKHLKSSITPERQVEALRTMEMARNGMLMYTSCAWFFCEISGIETVQNLQYAARAMELIKQLSGKELEDTFIKHLEKAPSNDPAYGNGANLYRKLVRPAAVSRERLISQYGIRALLSSEAPAKANYHFTIHTVTAARPEAAGLRTYAGHLRVRSGITTEEREFLNLVVELPDHSFRSYVKPWLSADEFKALVNRLESVEGDTLLTNGMIEAWRPFFGERSYTLKDLFTEEKERIYQVMLQERLEQLRGVYALLLTYYMPILEGYHDLGLKIPDHLKQEAELALGREMYFEVQKLVSNRDPYRLEMIRERAVAVKDLGISVNWTLSEKTMRKLMFGTLNEVLQNPEEATLKFFKSLVVFSLEAGPKTWRFYTETRVFRLLMYLFASPETRLSSGIEEMSDDVPTEHFASPALRTSIVELSEKMGFDVAGSPLLSKVTPEV